METTTESPPPPTNLKSPPAPSGAVHWAGWLLRRREAGIFLALLALMGLITLYKHEFADQKNLYLVCRQVAYIAIVALGVFFVILTSGIDLSIGATVSLAGVMCGWAMSMAPPKFLPCLALAPVLAIGLGMFVGALVGAFNAGVVSYLGVTPFIVTLGSMGMARGIVLVLTRGETIMGVPESYIRFGVADILGVPFPVVVLLLVAITAHIVLTYTAFGRRVYAVGGNEEATRLSGINVKKIKCLAYIISGVLSSITGILYVARFRSAQANAGLGMEMDAIAAAVIGGTSLMGGEGSVIGVLIGAMVMGVIRNGLVLMDISSYWQDFIIGAIIVLAAILDKLRTKRRV
ncbi:MAG TPA: ABC transporter permease [Planctomycetota bacterium]|jgi:ribose/xylose/arabinose/galactoside ABC-type transport system permease subunit